MKSLKIIAFVFLWFIVVQVTAQTVCITKTGEKYHRESCHYLRYSKIEITLEKAIKLQYDPCSVCKPVISKKLYEKENSIIPEVKSKPLRKTIVQCSGTTKSGSRCKRKTKNTNGRCYQH